jgi:hypothetical protein
MANVFNTNNAPAAHGPAVSKRLGRFAPAAALKAIAEIGATCDRIDAQRNQWLYPEALKAIADRRNAALADPSEKNLQALTGETGDQLIRRYENAANELFNVKTEAKRALHEHYVAVLEALRASLTEHMKALQAENEKAFAAWGIPYDAADDVMLLSLARYLEGAATKLDNPNCVCDVSEFREFVGVGAKPGLFSL